MLPVISAALLLWGAAVTTIAVKQEALLLHGAPLPGHVVRPADVWDRHVDVPGARLHGWLYQRPGGSKGLIMLLHGNSGNVANWLAQTSFWEQAGFDVFVLDYRGFGRSTGEPENEQQLHDDVWAAYQALAPAYQDKRLVIMGRSLGTGLAAKLAARIPSDLLVLVSPYASMQRMASERYPWVPGFALRYPLRTDELLPQAKAGRTLILHGDRDDLIPLAHAQALHARYPAAELVVVPGAGHNNMQASKLYLDTLMGALQAVPVP